MKTTNKILIIALLITFAFSTYLMLKVSSFIEIKKIETSGVYEEKTISLDEFDHLVAKNSVTVNYVVSDENKLHIEADTALFKYLISTVSDRKLVLNLDTPLHESQHALITVYSKVPSSIKVEKGAKFRTNDTLMSDTLYLNLQRGGRIKLNTKLNYLNCDQWEGSEVNVSGESNSLRVHATQGSKFDGTNFKATEADLTALAGSQLNVFVTGSLSVKAFEGGIVKYKGDPKINNMNIDRGGKVSKAE